MSRPSKDPQSHLRDEIEHFEYLDSPESFQLTEADLLNYRKQPHVSWRRGGDTS